jgi:hypothetical protein
MRATRAAVTALVIGASVSACGSGSGGTTVQTGSGSTGPASAALPVDGKPFPIDPTEFTTEIDNPYWPMKPGSQWVFRETDDQGDVSRVVVTVLDKTKQIADGVEARIVHDQLTQGGRVAEDTYDWYAQDAEGNLWYFGEDTTEYDNGRKSTEGSWEAGVHGALPGVIMPADPQVGTTYREEYYKGHAEDAAEIIGTNAFAKVPAGSYDQGVQTRNFSPIEPDVIEEKIYAKDVGVVLEITVSGGSDRDELLSYREG